MKIQLEFKPTVYSSNKENIKKTFALLGYKYVSGRNVGEQLICTWNRKEDNKNIKAIFNGSGQACIFIVDTNEEDKQYFEHMSKVLKLNIFDYQEDNKDNQSLKIKAKEIVDKWFVSQVVNRQPGEPDAFYNNRIKKEKETYQWFIDMQYKKMIGE